MAGAVAETASVVADGVVVDEVLSVLAAAFALGFPGFPKYLVKQTFAL